MRRPTRMITAVAALFAAAGANAEGVHTENSHGHDMLDQMRFATVHVDRLEWRDGDGAESTVWEAGAYYGDSLQRFGIETDGERSDGVTEAADAELLYRRAIAPFWDFKLGWRHDFQPDPQRDWFALGIDGLVPYGIDSETMVYVGDEGRVLLDLKLGYELLLTQRLSIEPEIELSAASKSDDETESGSGLSSVEVGLRLHYTVTRKFAPYVGVVWEKAYGGSADFIQSDGEDVKRTQIVAGVQFWL